MKIARRYLISGRVQAVGFRFFTEAAASREGIEGWVRNLPDGRVEVRAEGDVESIDRFDRAIRHGPSAARVEHVEIFDDVPGSGGAGFSVR